MADNIANPESEGPAGGWGSLRSLVRIYGEAWPINKSEAIDCIDLVILCEHDLKFYAWWNRLHELYKTAIAYMKENSSYTDPIIGQGMYEIERVKSRYEFKRSILQGYAERKGYVIV